MEAIQPVEEDEDAYEGEDGETCFVAPPKEPEDA